MILEVPLLLQYLLKNDTSLLIVSVLNYHKLIL